MGLCVSLLLLLDFFFLYFQYWRHKIQVLRDLLKGYFYLFFEASLYPFTFYISSVFLYGMPQSSLNLLVQEIQQRRRYFKDLLRDPKVILRDTIEEEKTLFLHLDNWIRTMRLVLNDFLYLYRVHGFTSGLAMEKKCILCLGLFVNY